MLLKLYLKKNFIAVNTYIRKEEGYPAKEQNKKRQLNPDWED